jgi:hypothetical protein
VCRACGDQQDVSHKDIKGFFTRCEREHAFHVDLDHITLPGLCQACYESECQAGRQPAQRPPAAAAPAITPRKPRRN